MSDNSDNYVLIVSDVEHATILNALRHWQASGHPVYPEIFSEFPSGPVAEDEVDDFIERINTEVNLDMMCVLKGGYVTHALTPDATCRINLMVLDLDVDGVGERDLTTVQLPGTDQHVQAMLYGLEANTEAKDFIDSLISETSGDGSPAAQDSNLDLFESHVANHFVSDEPIPA